MSIIRRLFGLADAAADSCIEETIDLTEWHERGSRLSDTAPETRGFESGKQIRQSDTLGRPVCFEGWVDATKGPQVPDDLKSQVCGVFRPDQVYMHLQSRALGGGAFANNGAPGTPELNASSVPLEKDAVALSRLKDVYFRQVFEYSGESREVKGVDVQIWLRGQDGKPELLAGRHATDNGSSIRDYGPSSTPSFGGVSPPPTSSWSSPPPPPSPMYGSCPPPPPPHTPMYGASPPPAPMCGANPTPSPSPASSLSGPTQPPAPMYGASSPPPPPSNPPPPPPSSWTSPPPPPPSSWTSPPPPPPYQMYGGASTDSSAIKSAIGSYGIFPGSDRRSE